MTRDELVALRGLIDADATLAAMPNTPDDAYRIAEALNAPAGVRFVSRLVTARAVLAERGAFGAAILTKLETLGGTVDAVRWAMRFVSSEGEGIDIGHPVTRALFAQLVQGGALAQEEADTILLMAQVPSSRALDALGVPVTWQQVAEARALQ